MNLTIENVSKYYNKKCVLKNIDLELTAGVYGILGANGSGKTTLMRILASVLRPTTGRVLLDNRDIMDLNGEYRELIGYLPQQEGLYHNFTVEKFLLYISSLKGLMKENAHERTREVLKLTGLEEHAKKKIGKFSGGMKRRVGIAQALLNDPYILIVDEPTAGLDPKERIRFRNLLSHISSNRIVLLSTHIVSDIEYIAKEVLILKEGQLIKKETPNRLLQDMKGYVWSLEIHSNDVAKFKEHYQVTNLNRIGENVLLRLICKNQPHPNAKQEVPNLEDLYLHYFDEESSNEESI